MEAISAWPYISLKPSETRSNKDPYISLSLYGISGGWWSLLQDFRLYVTLPTLKGFCSMPGRLFGQG